MFKILCEHGGGRSVFLTAVVEVSRGRFQPGKTADVAERVCERLRVSLPGATYTVVPADANLAVAKTG